MAEHNNLYQNVVYYDVIFERDVCREVDFILAAYHHYTEGEGRRRWRWPADQVITPGP